MNLHTKPNCWNSAERCWCLAEKLTGEICILSENKWVSISSCVFIMPLILLSVIIWTFNSRETPNISFLWLPIFFSTTLSKRGFRGNDIQWKYHNCREYIFFRNNGLRHAVSSQHRACWFHLVRVMEEIPTTQLKLKKTFPQVVIVVVVVVLGHR